MKAAIVGGGVGGLAAAIALGRAGVEVEVFEQAPALEPVGASLSLGPNAVRLLDEWRLGEALRRLGAVPDTVDLLRWDDGALLHRTTLGPAMEERFGAPQLDFFRPDLQQVLLEALTGCGCPSWTYGSQRTPRGGAVADAGRGAATGL